MRSDSADNKTTGDIVGERHSRQQPGDGRGRRSPRLPLGGKVPRASFSPTGAARVRLRDRQSALGTAEGAGAGVFRLFLRRESPGARRRAATRRKMIAALETADAELYRGLWPTPGPCPADGLNPCPRAVGPCSPDRQRRHQYLRGSFRNWPSGSWPPAGGSACWCPPASPPKTPRRKVLRQHLIRFTSG